MASVDNFKQVVESLGGSNKRRLGRALGLEEPDMDEIEHSFNYSLHEQMFQMLVTWKNRNGFAATAEELQKRLESIGAQNVADMLGGMAI